jgi:hypothetical protein
MIKKYYKRPFLKVYPYIRPGQRKFPACPGKKFSLPRKKYFSRQGALESPFIENCLSVIILDR